MTKVQTTFQLSRPLNDTDAARIAQMHAVYGFLAVRLAGSGDKLFVEYDASRLTPKEVSGFLEQNGLPLAGPAQSPEAAMPAGESAAS
jgi:hypothetical protein